VALDGESLVSYPSVTTPLDVYAALAAIPHDEVMRKRQAMRTHGRKLAFAASPSTDGGYSDAAMPDAFLSTVVEAYNAAYVAPDRTKPVVTPTFDTPAAPYDLPGAVPAPYDLPGAVDADPKKVEQVPLQSLADAAANPTTHERITPVYAVWKASLELLRAEGHFLCRNVSWPAPLSLPLEHFQRPLALYVRHGSLTMPRSP
jgi:hypothetical protein